MTEKVFSDELLEQRGTRGSVVGGGTTLEAEKSWVPFLTM
jgi:hypothetical protein